MCLDLSATPDIAHVVCLWPIVAAERAANLHVTALHVRLSAVHCGKHETIDNTAHTRLFPPQPARQSDRGRALCRGASRCT